MGSDMNLLPITIVGLWLIIIAAALLSAKADYEKNEKGEA